MNEPQPAPLFDRAMLASVLPALLLPVIAAVAGVAGALLRESLGGGSDGIAGLVVAVYCFVLLGSMALNGWLLLRHPQTLTSGAAGRPVSIVLAVLSGLLILWIVLLSFGIIGGAGLAFGIVLAVLSVVVFFLAIARYIKPGSVPRLESAGLPTWGRAAAVGYLTVAVIALLVALASPFIGFDLSDGAGVIGGPQTWALIVLGLPWSHPLYFAAVVVLFGVSDGSSALIAVPTVLAGLGTIANIVLVGLVLFSPVRRVAIANWFFRLGRTTAAQAEPTPPEA
jgi:hypothetical protein